MRSATISGRDARQLVESGRAKVLSVIPFQGTWKRLLASPPTTVITVGAEEGKLLALMGQSEELYRHFDSMRLQLAQFLLVLTGGISIGPFLEPIVEQGLSGPLGLASAITIFCVSRSAQKQVCVLDSRMLEFRTRSKLLREKLFEANKEKSKSVEEIIREAKEKGDSQAKRKCKALKNATGNNSDADTSRTGLWHLVPTIGMYWAAFLCIYSIYIIGRKPIQDFISRIFAS